MNLRRTCGWSLISTIAFSLLWAQAALGQTFSSGSTGADGPLILSNSQTQSITVRAGGVYNYTTVTLDINAQLNFVPGSDNSPVVILATGDVSIGAGAVISVNGNAGSSTSPTTGGTGGPGGFAGGNGGVSPNLAAAGQGPGGGQPIAGTPGAAQRGTYGAPDAFVTLIPLFGGSGGAGSGTSTGNPAGAGGGGAILIASSTRITLAGTSSTIRANGGNAGGFCNSTASSAGSGGAIRLVAPQIQGIGQLRAIGGSPCSGTGGTPGGDGRIRLEASSLAGFTGSAIPTPSISTVPGAVSAVGDPVLVNVPTLAIASIGGQSLPPTMTASYFVPDITLPLATTNPVPVALTATNTPVGAPTAMAVRLIPQSGSWTDVPVTSHTGTFASSTASADVTFPVGRVSVVQAIASFTLTGQTASLFPLIDGEPVERVMVAASPGEPSTVSLVSKSGKEVRLDQLRAEDRIKVALAWETLRGARN